MTDREILTRLVDHYHLVLKNICNPEYCAQESYEMKKHIESAKCHQGVCYVSYAVFGVPIAERWWMKQFEETSIPVKTPFGTAEYGYWFTPPMECFTVKDLKQAISLRLNRLTEILNSI